MHFNSQWPFVFYITSPHSFFVPASLTHITTKLIICIIHLSTPGKDDDIVKLYDLTSLCLEGQMGVDGREEETPAQDSGNPFTVPVAMLFYRVAKNMRASEDANKKIASIRALLKNSLTLLDNAKYPKVAMDVMVLFFFLFAFPFYDVFLSIRTLLSDS